MDEGAVVEDPQVVRRRIRCELRRLRDEQQLSHRQVAEGLCWPTSKLIRIEAGAVSIARSDLESLLDLYSVAEEDRARLRELQRSDRRSESLRMLSFYDILKTTSDADGVGPGQRNRLLDAASTVRAALDGWRHIAGPESIDAAHHSQLIQVTFSSPASDHSGLLALSCLAWGATPDCMSQDSLSDDSSLPFIFNVDDVFVSDILAFLGRILSMLLSALARLTLARIAVSAYALIGALIIAAFMSHRHRHEPASDTFSRVVNCRPLAGAVVA